MSKDTVYEMITEQVVTMLENGTAPWRQPWNAATDAPRNLDGRQYHGVNVFLLTMARHMHGYSSPFWLTYKQAQAKGGQVRKGEKSAVVIFWKQLRVKDDDADPDDRGKTIPVLRYYRVFNVDQVDGIDAPVVDGNRNEHVSNVTAEQIISGYVDGPGPTFSETGSAAFYVPGDDHVTLPPRESFDAADNFYATAFHELGHSTGHPDRLARKHQAKAHRFGSHDYGREELVAEMTSAFLSAEAGITSTLPLSASYLQSWVKAIREDVRAVVVAAGAAQKAADFVLGNA